jgi:hypothetical protein
VDDPGIPHPGLDLDVTALRLGLLAGMALLHRLILHAFTTTIGTDGPAYLEMARLFSVGSTSEAMSSRLHPFFPALVAAIGSPFGSMETGAIIVSIGASSLAVIPLYFLIRDLWTERLAFWTAAIYALHPIIALETSEVLGTGLFLSLFIAGFSCGMLALRGKRWVLFPLCGFLAGLCYLTRVEGLVLFPAFGTAALGVLIFRRPLEAGWGRLAFGLGAALVTALLTAGPFLIWIHSSSGVWALSPRPSSTQVWSHLSTEPETPGQLVSKPPEPTPAKPPPPTIPDKPPTPAPTVETPKHPAPTPPPKEPGPAREIGKKLLRAVYWPILFFILAGVACRRPLGQPVGTSVLLGLLAMICWIPPCLYFILVPGSHLSHRYLLGGVLFLLPWAASGMIRLGDAVAPLLARAGPARLRAGVAWVLLAALLTGKSLGPRRPEEITYLEAARWAKEQKIPPMAKVIDTTGKIPYYAGCRSDSLWQEPQHPGRWVRTSRTTFRPRTGGDEALSFSHDAYLTFCIVHSRRAPYLFVDERTVTHYYGGEQYLRELESIGFEKVTQFDRSGNRRGTTVWVYRIADLYR